MQSEIITSNHILHIPKWYPHQRDPQNGVFIRKQIESVSGDFVHSVLFIYSSDQNQKIKVEASDEDHILVVRAGYPECNYRSIFSSIVQGFRYLKAFKAGFGIILRKNGIPAIIHAHVLLRNGLLAMLLAKYFKIKYVVSEHWSGYFTGAFDKKNRIYRKLCLLVLNRAFRVIAVSDKLAEKLVSVGVNRKSISVIPNIVESKPIITTDQPLTEKGRVVILSVADLVDDIKNISDVIRAVYSLSHDFDIEYRIVGDGQDKDRLEAYAERLGVLGTRVKFLGRKTNDEVLNILHDASFLVMNSIVETFSVVTAEALLAGKPVLATRCGGPEMFVNFDNGVLIDPAHYDTLLEAMEWMIRSYKSYDPEKIRNSVGEKFSRKAIGDSLKVIYDKILTS